MADYRANLNETSYDEDNDCHYLTNRTAAIRHGQRSRELHVCRHLWELLRRVCVLHSASCGRGCIRRRPLQTCLPLNKPANSRMTSSMLVTSLV